MENVSHCIWGFFLFLNGVANKQIFVWTANHSVQTRLILPSSEESAFTSLVMIYVSKSPVFEIMQLPFIGAFFCGRLMCLFPLHV